MQNPIVKAPLRLFGKKTRNEKFAVLFFSDQAIKHKARHMQIENFQLWENSRKGVYSAAHYMNKNHYPKYEIYSRVPDSDRGTASLQRFLQTVHTSQMHGH